MESSSPARPYTDPRIDEYLRERLMPLGGTIPRLPGIEMYGNSIPVGTVGGDLFEYINFVGSKLHPQLSCSIRTR
jgi:hypothetical protein